ncbi:MAG: flagellar protein export ATPase FliI [Halothiobacillaceae bacterium]|nr:flagellar protein export ATPase FliI [Halothiobacillaceae bacterium]
MVVSARRSLNWASRLAEHAAALGEVPPPVVEGVLTRVIGMALEAEGCQAAVGDQCLIRSPVSPDIEAEVVGFAEGKLYLMPLGELQGLVPGARVIPIGRSVRIPVGDALLGRVLDGTGKPLDGRGPLPPGEPLPLSGRQINPLARRPVREPLDVGVRGINALLTVGRGQRMGLFAGSGVGKSVLLGMMTRYTRADVIVVGLIGERGREVKEFVQEILGPEGLARAVVVAAPADSPPLMRIHGSWLATTIAEYFRDRGRSVLLLIDSLSRFAQAQREIALAIGEPPATKGYPPSVFARLPQLVERAGNGSEEGGSITAFYTVLAEGDDQNDPIADAARAILDGHIVLSRTIAERGRYPAIDVEASISRVMPSIVSREHRDAAQRFKQIVSTYSQNRDLISVGAYRRGTDSRIDAAVDFYPRLEDFMRQDIDDSCDFSSSVNRLMNLLNQ